MENSTRLFTRIHHSFNIAIVLVFMISCNNSISFMTSAVVPAAQGNVKIKTDDNNNYQIKINVSGLAESSRLSPSKNTYVAWITTENGEVRNLGKLQTSKLNASLKTVSSFKPVNVFLTAEDDGNILSPSGEVILTTAEF
ncbi:MAG TPA: hypothetical protein VLB84_05775 [Bacteroidia bacterium]|nr:hypothetical protein [Bacteroidia bacterium]